MIYEAEVKRRFNYHAPQSAERVKGHEHIRTALRVAARIVLQETPSSREQSLAITKLEEAMFWAMLVIVFLRLASF